MVLLKKRVSVWLQREFARNPELIYRVLRSAHVRLPKKPTGLPSPRGQQPSMLSSKASILSGSIFPPTYMSSEAPVLIDVPVAVTEDYINKAIKKFSLRRDQQSTPIRCMLLVQHPHISIKETVRLFRNKGCLEPLAVVLLPCYAETLALSTEPHEAFAGLLLNAFENQEHFVRQALRVVGLACLRSMDQGIEMLNQIFWISTHATRRRLMRTLKENDWLQNKQHEWLTHELSEFIQFLENRGRVQAQREVLQHCIFSVLEQNGITKQSRWYQQIRQLPDIEQLHTLVLQLHTVQSIEQLRKRLRAFFRRKSR